MKIIDKVKEDLRTHRVEDDEIGFHYKARRYHLCLELARFETSEKYVELALKLLTADNFQFLIKKYRGKR